SGTIVLGRGQVISRIEMSKYPGSFPVYSSSVRNQGLFGSYGKYMFHEPLITWSVDGGGHFFYRPPHKFSVTNVSGFMKIDTDRFDYRFVAACLQAQHARLSFDYQSKAHPSVIVNLYELPEVPLSEQQRIALILEAWDQASELLQRTIDLK